MPGLVGPDQSLFERRLKIPEELPGASAPALQLPPINLENPVQRSQIVDKLFPDRPPMPPIAPPASIQQRPAMTLRQLEDLAMANNPTLVQAAGNIAAAEGTAVQAGTHPNPVIGYEADTVGSFDTRNYQGVFAQQIVKTAGKLGLQRGAANMDFMNAQLQLRRTRADVLRQVRGRILRRARGAGKHFHQHRIGTFHQRGLPHPSRATSVRAGDRLRTGTNAHAGRSGSQCAACSPRTVMSRPGNSLLRPSAFWICHRQSWRAGRICPSRSLNYDSLLGQILNFHTDVLAARNLQTQAQLQLRLQNITPIPDLQLYGAFQQDFTTPGFARTSYNVQVGVPVPVFDRNRGNILSAEGRLRSAAEQIRTIRNQLTAQLADAFERFETNRTQVKFYRDQILPDLAPRLSGHLRAAPATTRRRRLWRHYRRAAKSRHRDRRLYRRADSAMDRHDRHRGPSATRRSANAL